MTVKIPDFTAIILDMDGLILDTEKTYTIAWRNALNTLGFQFCDDFWATLIGLSYQGVEEKISESCGSGFHVQKFRTLSADYWRRYVQNHGIAIQEGFHELFKVIKEFEIPYCLATNSLEANARECLQLAGIVELFPVLITRDDVHKGKPEPDIFLKAAEALAVDIKRCLVVEDSHAGIVAASRAGAFAVLIPSIIPVDTQTAASANLILNDLRQLAAIIRIKCNKK
jgi:HAD superfamily hydrolase (TIGR01509 family)